MKYRVVFITNNVDSYTTCKKDTEEFPHLIDYIEDEMEVFVIDENGKFWIANEFFVMTDVNEFITE